MKKILLAYDGGEPARRALMTAAELARAFHAPLSVVSVVPEAAGRPRGDPWGEARAHARDLQDAKRLLAEMGLEVELLEPSGDPARRIEQIAAEGEFDTIVLGSGADGDVDRVGHGGVSRHVVAHAVATVVVARQGRSGA
jgi:nucleotide-binding universal stress UspA family protein